MKHSFIEIIASMFLFSVLMASPSEAKEPAPDLQDLYSPHSVTLGILGHSMGNMFGEIVGTHYTIAVMVEEKVVAEIDNKYSYSGWGLENVQEDLKLYEKKLSEARRFQKLVLVKGTYSTSYKNEIEIVKDSDPYLQDKEDQRELRCYNSLIFRGSLLGPDYVKGIEELLKKVKGDFNI